MTVREQAQAAGGTRVVTIPNALSALRLVGVPVFLWLVLTERDAAAILLLMAAGASDYFDGKLARRWNQVSRIGALLDPAADRLYILATLVGLTIRDVIPLWLTLAIVIRDLVLAATLPLLRKHGFAPLPVNYMGKAATFTLLYAFPLLLLGDGTGTWATLGDIFGWAFATWGVTLYWWAGLLYLVQVRQVIRTPPAASAVTP